MHGLDLGPVDPLLCGVRHFAVAGPEVGRGNARAAKNATSVQPNLARTSRPLRVDEAAQHGMIESGSGRGGHIDDLDEVTVVDRRRHDLAYVFLGLLGERSGANR